MVYLVPEVRGAETETTPSMFCVANGYVLSSLKRELMKRGDSVNASENAELAVELTMSNEIRPPTLEVGQPSTLLLVYEEQTYLFTEIQDYIRPISGKCRTPSGLTDQS